MVSACSQMIQINLRGALFSHLLVRMVGEEEKDFFFPVKQGKDI